MLLAKLHKTETGTVHSAPRKDSVATSGWQNASDGTSQTIWICQLNRVVPRSKLCSCRYLALATLCETHRVGYVPSVAVVNPVAVTSVVTPRWAEKRPGATVVHAARPDFRDYEGRTIRRTTSGAKALINPAVLRHG
jgi:hypothetical protein